MNCKCIGCGITLQNINKAELGFSNNIEGKLCERCFRIRNYNEYQKVDKTIDDFYYIISNINKTNDLVLLVVDLLNYSSEIVNLVNKLTNNILLVLSKRDIFSYKISDLKLLNSISIKCIDKIIISSNKNYNFDLLFEKINNYKNSNNVYVVGLTNSGKSTLINKIIYNYTDLDMKITTSILPSTTLDTIKIKINDSLNLIDTPGIIDNGNICNYLDNSILKKVFPKKEIKPITYQIKGKQYIYIENIIKIECLENCNLTFYFSNQLKIERLFKNVELSDLKLISLDIPNNSDVVINGIGFVNVKNKTHLNIYTIDNVDVFIRKEII